MKSTEVSFINLCMNWWKVYDCNFPRRHVHLQCSALPFIAWKYLLCLCLAILATKTSKLVTDRSMDGSVFSSTLYCWGDMLRLSVRGILCPYSNVSWQHGRQWKPTLTFSMSIVLPRPMDVAPSVRVQSLKLSKCPSIGIGLESPSMGCNGVCSE